MPDKDKPLSINEAFNKIKADEPANLEKVKKEAQNVDITTAPPKDRKNFLNYAISLLNDIDHDLSVKLPFNATSKQMARILKTFMFLRVNGVSDRQMAKQFGVERGVVKRVEIIGREAIKRAVERNVKAGVPIIGGLN